MASRDMGCRERILRLRREVVAYLYSGQTDLMDVNRMFDQAVYEVDMEEMKREPV